VGDLTSTGGMLTLTPDEHGTDGFFVAKLIKE
jgi:16S rRNA C967 or C1407 C5-methylase (RsmB/RsmF family)